MCLKYFSLCLFFFVSLNIFSQEMEEGFNYLETGKYKKAAFFFKEVLKTHPKNKTARLCYGRAIGLLGASEKAVQLFTRLLQDYPSDFEVKLNYAESLLWDKNFLEAKGYYEKLIIENSTSFPSLLGYANTLSNLKEYTNALIYIDKALSILPGNQNALVSKKYMRLGLANEKVINQKYIEAERILKENFTSFKDDKKTLLNLANLYLISKQIDKAIKTYEVIGENTENKLTALNGISLAHHLNGDDKTALSFSKKALESLDNTTSKTFKNQTTERYIQALIWNKKYALAAPAISTLLKDNKTPENWMLSLRATLNIYKSDFKKSLEDYNLILKKTVLLLMVTLVKRMP